MKKIRILILAVLGMAVFQQANAIVAVHYADNSVSKVLHLNDTRGGDQAAKINALLNLTPERYEQMTGKKLGFFSKIMLKKAQNKLAKTMVLDGNSASSASIPKGIYILLAFVGLGFLGIGLVSDWNGNDWWINLLLTFLFWLPGFIHALIVMSKYY